MSTNILQPQTHFDVKFKKHDFADDDITKLALECANKTVCLYFCKISEEALEKIIESCSMCTYMNTSQQVENINLVMKYSNHPKLSCFLTHLTYEQYGEMVHPLKMMMEKQQDAETKISIVEEKNI